MNIIDGTALPTVKFKTLSDGDVFKYAGHFYMKLTRVESGLGTILTNAVRLNFGNPVIICLDDDVIPVEHELIIKP